MKPILRTSSVSFAESLRIALEAKEIEAVVNNENSAGIVPPAITVAVTDDAAYERALAVLRDIEGSAPRLGMPSASGAFRLLVAVIVAIVILVCLNL